ncbi:MAG: hypothetical protein KA976_04710 [Paludibacteraceae bacterium]|jgi:hypothetical protein|nr:hypothetical protein [Paludibacteraceae bacterium]
MAYFISSTFGNISGRHGTAVAAVDKNGNNVLRLYRKPTNPNSPKQLEHRMKFSVINKGLAPLREVIKLGYRDTRAFPKVTGKAFSEAILGEYPDFSIDFEKVRIASGKLQPVEGTMAKITEGTFDVNFSWNATVGLLPKFCSENDTINIVCFNVNSSFPVLFTNVATRMESAAVVTLPETWKGNDIHCWLYLTSEDGLLNSNSVYVAALTL